MTWRILCGKLKSTLYFKLDSNSVSLREESIKLQGYEEVRMDKDTAIIFARRILNYYEKEEL